MLSKLKNAIILIGASSWDILASPDSNLIPKKDCAGTIIQRPGGVILNVANHLIKKEGLAENLFLFSAVGSDLEGKKIIRNAKSNGLPIDNIVTDQGCSDKFLVIETEDGTLHSAISDFKCIARAESKILQSLLKSSSVFNSKIKKTIVLDGNLSETAILQIFKNRNCSMTDFNFVSASSIKSEKLMKIIYFAKTHKIKLCMYLNFSEAESIANKPLDSVTDAAEFLILCGLSQVVITNGSQEACSAEQRDTGLKIYKHKPNKLIIKSSLGAGDIFAAEHIYSKVINTNYDEHKRLSAAASAADKYLST